MIISIDFETYSESEISKTGAWAYSCHPSTEVICLAYSENGNDVLLETNIGNIKRLVCEFIKDEKIQLRAWNSFFEMSICANVLGIKEVLNPKKWIDTAAQAAALSLPRSLGECSEVVGLPQDKQKNKRGKFLIQRLCKPFRGSRVKDEDFLNELYSYCMQDVVAETSIAKKLIPLSENERKIWELDQAINIRGVYVDTRSVDNALILIDKQCEILKEEASSLTGKSININSRLEVINYLESKDITLKSFDKNYLKSLIDSCTLPPDLNRLIEIRLSVGKTSTAKYKALKNITTTECRCHGLLMYHGANTGRWAGKLFQPQNLPRPSFDNIDDCIELFKYRDPEIIDIFFCETMDALSSCLRGMICAPKGKKLIVSDYSSIEARVLCWLAGQDDVLNVFRSHGDLYQHNAAAIYGVPVNSVTKEQRFIGKVATLALGYQGGGKAFTAMAKNYGVDIQNDTAEKIKSEWRKSNNKIVSFWHGCQQAAFEAVRNMGERFYYGKISFRCAGNFLTCKLPSNRHLAYLDPRIEKGNFDHEQVTFMGASSVTKKWGRQFTYGGKLVENITQAVARDILAEAMLRLEKNNYEIVLSVHDEIIAEVPENFGSVQEFEKIMCEPPCWAKDLPLSAEGFECLRYRK